VPLQRWPSLAGGEDPVWVHAEQTGIRVDHFGLDPEPELHAAGTHVAGELTQPGRPDSLIDLPVTQAGPVAAASGEPAVVEDEQEVVHGRQAELHARQRDDKG